MNTRKKLIAGGAIGALSLVLVSAVLGSSIETEYVETGYMTSGPLYENVRDLATDSRAVVRARVVAVGHSYRIAPDPPVVVVAPTPAVQKKGSAAPAAIPSGTRPANLGPLNTDVTIEVLETIKGDHDYAGQRLTVAQLGGIDEGGRSIGVENDPLLKVGDQEILFLKHDGETGKFFTTGGGQGRFGVSDRGTVTARDQESPVGYSHHGKRVEELTDAVRAAR